MSKDKKINPKLIADIAQNIDCGLDCYYNPETEEVITIPSYSIATDEDELMQYWGDQIKKVQDNESDYIKIEVLQSYESYDIMEDFVEQLPNSRLKFDLEDALQKRKPFQNFKYIVDNSDVRQDWFDFKQSELEKIVERRIRIELEEDL